MTVQTKKRIPFLLIITIALIAFCVFCLFTSAVMNKMGLLPTPNPVTLSPTETAIPLATADPAQPYLDEYGGNPDVYIRIFSFTDCADLQKEFDQASENLNNQQPGTDQYKWGIGYMAASDDRMKAIGCYK